MPKITKPQLVEAVAEITNTPKAQVAQVVDCLPAQVSVHATNGADVYLHGFGTFTSKHKPARMGRNPATGAPVAISARQVLAFSAAKPRAAAAPKGGV